MRAEDELVSKIAKLLENFLKIHSTVATRRINTQTLDYGNLDDVFDIFNNYISWYDTYEGGPYYYFLNLRWVIGLAYLCHEHSKEYDDYCLGKIDKYYSFCGGDFPFAHFNVLSYTRKEAKQKYEYYTKKVKKIREIFGN